MATAKILKDERLTPQQQAEFRTLLLAYTEEIPNADADGLIKRVMIIERWIGQQITNAVFTALRPYIQTKE